MSRCFPFPPPGFQGKLKNPNAAFVKVSKNDEDRKSKKKKKRKHKDDDDEGRENRKEKHSGANGRTASYSTNITVSEHTMSRVSRDDKSRSESEIMSPVRQLEERDSDMDAKQDVCLSEWEKIRQNLEVLEDVRESTDESNDEEWLFQPRECRKIADLAAANDHAVEGIVWTEPRYMPEFDICLLPYIPPF